MAIEAWRAIAQRFGLKYGVEVHVGGTQACCKRKAIYLPGDVKPGMQEVLHALFLHEKEHILQGDVEFTEEQEKALSYPLNVVQDIHNDELVRNQEPGYSAMWKKVDAYLDDKMPREFLYQMAWQKQAVLWLLAKTWPDNMAGWEFTKCPQVKHFFHRHAGKIRRMLRDLRDLRPDHQVQLKWAKWLLATLFADAIQGIADKQGIPGAAGGGGGEIPDEVMEALGKLIEKMGGLVPRQRQPNNFECICPGDLRQKVPEAVTVQRLKEFLTENMTQKVDSDSGGIDPAMLPHYMTDPDAMFKADEETITKRVRVYLLLDASGSMAEELEDKVERKDALMRAVGLVCQAAERIVRQDGYDIEIEAWAFGTSDRMIKMGGERWDPSAFKSRYWRGRGDGGTAVAELLKNISAYPDSQDTKSVVLLITDGEFEDAGKPELDAAISSGSKHWVLIGLGKDLPDPQSFRFVANSLEEVEYILCQAVKEGMK